MFSVCKRKIKTLKPSHFVSSVVGLFVGFTRHKRVIDWYARCLMCKADISIAGRWALGALQNLWEQKKSAELSRLEQMFRIKTQRTLLDKWCRPVSVYEDRRNRLARKTEPPAYLESIQILSGGENCYGGGSGCFFGATCCAAESANYLWLSQFINCFAVVTDFRSFIQMQDRWTVTMRGR